MDGLKATLSFDAVAYDYDDEYLTIDTDTHIININNVSRLFGVQYDGNSKLIKFRISNKLSDIQKMQDSIVYINWIDSKGVKGQSIAIDKTISNNICEFAWKVPFDALKKSGVLHFAMSAVITENNSSVINQKWSTQIASVTTPDGIYIKSYTPSSEEEDRIAQIYSELVKMINKQNYDLSKKINEGNTNLQAQVNSLKEDIDDGKKTFEKFNESRLIQDRKLNALWKLNQGISYEFESDTTSKYNKDVPSGAKLANIKKIGGYTIVFNQGIESNLSFKGTTSSYYIQYITNQRMLANHKYLLKYKVETSVLPFNMYIGGVNENGNYASDIFSMTNILENGYVSTIVSIDEDMANKYNEIGIRFIRYNELVSFDYDISNIQLFDLTKMFGIGKEPSSVPAFEAIFPNEYYLHNKGILLDTKVKDVLYHDTNYSIPSNIQNMDGYGIGLNDRLYNYVDFENKKFHKKVQAVKIGKDTSVLKNSQSSNDWLYYIEYTNGSQAFTDIKCDRFTTLSNYPIDDKYAEHCSITSSIIYFNLKGLADENNEASAKQWLIDNDITIYIPTKDENTIDISEYLDNLNFDSIEVGDGGTLEFKNANTVTSKISIPSDIEYVVSLSEVSK